MMLVSLIHHFKSLKKLPKLLNLGKYPLLFPNQGLSLNNGFLHRSKLGLANEECTFIEKMIHEQYSRISLILVSYLRHI